MEGNGNATGWVSVEEAAAELGTTTTRILTMLRSKELLGEEADGAWRIARPSLLCAKAHGTDRKVASGCASYCASKCGCG